MKFAVVFDLNLSRHVWSSNLRKQNVRKQKTIIEVQKETRQGKNECQPIALLSESSGAYEAQVKANNSAIGPPNKVRCQAE